MLHFYIINDRKIIYLGSHGSFGYISEEVNRFLQKND